MISTLLLAPLTGCASSQSAGATSGDSASPAADEKGEKKEGDDEKKEEAVPVEVVALDRGPIEELLRFSSNLEAEEAVEVVSQAKRQVTALLVEEGSRVRRGDLLLRLQDEEQRSAIAKVRSQLDKAEREYSRQQQLYQQQLISEQAWNDATYQLDQLRIQLADAERELSYTEVRAPISGTITERLVNLGDQVQIGQHLFDLVDFDSIVAQVFVPEKHLPLLRPGLEARVTAQVAGGAQHVCRVRRVAPIVDPKSGTVKVTVEVGGREGLRPGMYVDVGLITATHVDAILVPKRALVYDNEQAFVYRLTKDDRVERVFVETALADKHHVEPAGGFTPGERVVVAGQAGLKDGALVSYPGQIERDQSLEAADGKQPPVERASR